MKRGLALALFVACLSGCATYNESANLSYDPANVPYGVFNVYQPPWYADDGSKARPAIFFIHGGAWEGGDKNDGDAIAKEFCPSGYVVFSCNYHLTTDYTMPGGVVVKGAPWPEQILNCEKALRWVRANAAQWRVNPDKMASMGVSAGGQLATMICLRDDPQGPIGRTLFAVDCDGEQDMTQPGAQVMTDFYDTPGHQGIMSLAMGHPQPWTAAELRNISPVFYARKDAAVYIVHGDQDPNVFVNNAYWLNTALKAAGAEVSLHIVTGTDGKGHGKVWESTQNLPELHKWLDDHLKK